MRTYHNLRGAFSVVTLSALIAAGITGTDAASAAPADSSVSVRVAALKNTGGVIGKGPDGKPIDERFSMAMQKILTDTAKGRYVTSDSKNTDFVIEGELSALESDKGAPTGYLCTIRLFQTATSGRRLVGQWSGTARGLRDLTGNLSKDSQVSNLGLAGEFAERVGQVIVKAAGDPAPVSPVTTPEVYNALIKNAVALRRLTVDVIPEGATDQKPRNTLLPGQKYRLRVSPQDTGMLYIFALGEKGKPSSPYAQNEALGAAPGRSVVLPPNVPFVAPSSGSADWVVLLRRTPGAASVGVLPVAPHLAGSLPVPGVTLLPGAREAPPATPQYGVADTPQYGVPDTPQYGVTEAPPQYGVPDVAPDKAVTVIGGAMMPSTMAPSIAPKSLLDPEAERILTMMKNDPAGTWVALEIKLPVVAGDKVGAPAPDARAPKGEIKAPGGVIIKKQP